MLSKLETAGVGLLLWFLLKEGTSKAATPAERLAVDGDLVRRANQAGAHAWIAILVQQLELPEDIAEAAARWFGIESSGNALAVSSAGERTLAQITRTSALKEGGLTQAQWDSAIDPSLSPGQQAKLGWDVIEWCWSRAKKYVPNEHARDAIDQLWYAKIYHQAPVEMRDGKMTGDAAADSRRLESAWAGDGKKIHHLHAANVVAWGSVLPP